MPAAAGEEGHSLSWHRPGWHCPSWHLPTPGVLHWRALLLALAQCTCRLWTEKIQFNSFLLMDIEGKIIVLNAKKPGGKGICVSFVQ